MQFIYLLQDLNISKNILIGKRDKMLKASGLWKQEKGKVNSVLHIHLSPWHGWWCSATEDGKPGSYVKGLRTGISTHYLYMTSGHLNFYISINNICKHRSYYQDVVV